MVAWYAPSDIAAVATDAGSDPLDADHQGGAVAGRARRQRPGSGRPGQPDHATSGSAAPPILLLHGRADRLIPFRQSERLHAALVAAGADAQLHLYDDADHMWLGSPEAAADALQRTIAFLASAHLDTNGDRP